MTHTEIVQALLTLRPGASWSYDGDGTSLDPVYQGELLVSRGLEWHDASAPPTLAELETVTPRRRARSRSAR